MFIYGLNDGWLDGRMDWWTDAFQCMMLRWVEGVDGWCWCLILDILLDMGDTGATQYVLDLNGCIFNVYSIRIDDAEWWRSRKTTYTKQCDISCDISWAKWIQMDSQTDI